MKTVGTLIKAIAGTAFAVALAYLFYFGGQDLIRRPPVPPPPAPAWSAAPGAAPAAGAAVPDARPDFAAMGEAVRPAVVNISTTQAVRSRGPQAADPMREFLVGAVKTAMALLTDLRDRPPDLSPGPPLAVRAGISYGEILLDTRGVRHGATMNKAFRLEGLSRESFAQVGHEGPPPEILERNRIFMDEEAAKERREAGTPHRLVGFYSLKGFSGLHRVYEVLWEPRG